MMTSSSTRRLLLLGDDDLVSRSGLAEELVEAGWQVASASPGATGRLELADEHCSYGNRMRSALAPDSSLKTMMASFEPDVVHSFDTIPNLINGRLAASSSARHTATIAGRGRVFSPGPYNNSATQWVYRSLFARLNAAGVTCVFQNRKDQEYFETQQLVGGHSPVIPGSGVDVERFTPPTTEQRNRARSVYGLAGDDRPIALMVTRLLRSKGVEFFARLAQLWPGVHFVIAGPEGRGFDGIKQAALDAYPALTYLGSVPDPAPLYQAADVVVLPTRYSEGMPRVLLEGAASGCPLVCSDAPGCADVVVDGQNGFVESSDDPWRWIGHIRAAIDERDLLGKRGRELVLDNYTSDWIHGQYLKLWDDLMTSSRTIPSGKCVGGVR